MSGELPPALRVAIEAEASRFGGRELADAARALSERYRQAAGAVGPRTECEIAAYAVTRMPATYAATVWVLGEARERVSHPIRSVLDLGCGPGTATWAAFETFNDIDQATLIDRDAGMMELGQRLSGDRFKSATWALVPLDRGLKTTADLVVAGYAMNEVPPPKLAAIAGAIAAVATGLVAIIEPGTPRGHAVIQILREGLIARGFRVVAPCPHDRPCPLSPDDWCHFAARLPRLKAHKLAKGADVPFEDEPFSYCVLIAPSVSFERTPARILRRPVETKADKSFKLCTPEGLETVSIPGRDKDRTRTTRRLGWGDAFPL